MTGSFTEPARKALGIACAEARRLGHAVGTEHLLLGLIREPDDVATRTLARLGLPLATVRDDLERVLAARDRIGGEPGFSPQAQRVLGLARTEARRLGHRRIGTEAVLLALMREGESIAARLVAEFVSTRVDPVGAPARELLGAPDGQDTTLIATSPWRLA
jgi:ATP-dependent Clp protease ATP-binding subunit ClpC